MTPRQAVLLVGGRGTRMWPLTADTPKGLLPLAGVPFVDHQLELLAAAGVEEAFLAVGVTHLDAWRAYAESADRPVTVRLSVEETPLDTGGPVRALVGELDETFFVLNGDVVIRADLAGFAERAPGGAAATLALVEVEDTSAYGVVVVGEDGLVKRFVEKPPPEEAPARTVNAGIYLMSARAVAEHAEGPLSFERTVFPSLASSADLAGVTIDASWLDIGTPPLYLDTHDALMGEGAEAHVAPEGAATGGRWAWVADGARVASDALVEESVVLEGASVAPGAVVRRAIVGWDARIGEEAVVTGASVVGARAVVGSGCELDHGARIAPGAELPAGAVTFSPPS